MEQLFILLVITCLALGSPIAQEDGTGFTGDSGGGLLLAVNDDAKQSVAVLNMGDEKIVELEVDQGDNYRYETRHFDQGGGYQFGYDSHNVGEKEAKHFRHEVRRPDGTVLGRYGYEDANGEVQITNYISDKDGYQVLHPGVIVQLEPVENNENVEDNEIRGRSDIVNELEPETPIIHSVVPQGARDLQTGPHSFGYFLPLQ